MNLNRILSVSVQVPLSACRGQTDDMYCVCTVRPCLQHFLEWVGGGNIHTPSHLGGINTERPAVKSYSISSEDRSIILRMDYNAKTRWGHDIYSRTSNNRVTLLGWCKEMHNANGCSGTHVRYNLPQPQITTLLHMSQLGMTQWLHYHLLQLLRQLYWGGGSTHTQQSYRYISASGPGSCSCRCLAETCRRGWRMLSQYRTAPGRTGSGCLSRETQIEMKAQISPGKGRRPVKNSEVLVLPEVDSVNVFSSHSRRLHFLHKVTENDSWKQFGDSVISICA